jgi:glucose-6-phosphate isomerase
MIATLPETSLIEPFSVDLDLVEGMLHEPKNHVQRFTSQMSGHYADEEALQRMVEEHGDPLHYEVFETPVPNEDGHLMYCISKLQPGRVGDEFFMTKGHYHTKINTAETYLCLRGEGILLMKTSDGECRQETFKRGRMVYVPPYWGHRSINTGGEPLITFCVYPANAGHNYGDIETEGFPKRCVDRDGDVVIE